MQKSDPFVLSDDQLLERMHTGDQSAFNTIFDRYWDPLYRKAYQRLQDESSAKDAVQNVFISLWRRKNEVEIENLRSYLYGAIRFQVYKQIDHTNRHNHFFEPFEAMLVSPIRTDHDLIRDDLAKLLLAWINTLPGKRREIFVLHYRQQLTVQEIASQLGITRKTVYNQLNNCIKELQWKLAKYYTLLFLIQLILHESMFP